MSKIEELLKNAVKDYVKLFTFQLLPDPPGGMLQRNQDYRLIIAVQNIGSESFLLEWVQARIQGEPDQVEFYSDANRNEILSRDWQGRPRIHLMYQKFNPWTGVGPLPIYPDEIMTFPTVHFKMLRSLQKELLKFNIGIYAEMIPEGHNWVKAHWEGGV
ncbi:MAG: hypothetical protein ACFFCF_09520 [Promethearchaeota archaeon]